LRQKFAANQSLKISTDAHETGCYTMRAEYKKIPVRQKTVITSVVCKTES